jgi:membrane carboxypeptidase/penicillin-binding protein
MRLLRLSAAVFFSLATVSLCAASSDTTTPAPSATKSSHAPAKRRAHSSTGVKESASASHHIQQLQHGTRSTASAKSASHATVKSASLTKRRRRRYVEHFTASSFTSDNTVGDITAGEDPIVRQAAINALGDMNGTAVAIDPSNGRILAMVNQKLALSPGAEPCSTIKLMVGLAALSEGIVTRETEVNLGGHFHLTLTQALAKSNNLYFETLGRALGFERVKHYANTFGLGELAGYNLPGEQLGVYPDEPIAEKSGGVGRMCSFGEGVSMTPLQLGALVAAMANGGTLFYLQHPRSPEEAADFKPMVKRQLDIAQYVPQMFTGMEGAVNYGTARSLHSNFSEFPVLGKTGTCSNLGTRYGWFASIANTPGGRIVTVFFLEGGRPTFGPKAAELTGQFYRALYDSQYFGPRTTQTTISSLASPAVAAPVMQASYSNISSANSMDAPVQTGAHITTAPMFSAPAAIMPALPATVYAPPAVISAPQLSPR